MSPRSTLSVAREADVAAAARAAREEAERCGLTGVEAQLVATAVSEVAGNAIKYARGGAVELTPVERAGRRGLSVTVRDAGPGIGDVRAALRDGVSSSGSLGFGLPGARRLMDDFAITSGAEGTVVTMARWEGGCWRPTSRPRAPCAKAPAASRSRSRSATACCSGWPPARAPARSYAPGAPGRGTRPRSSPSAPASCSTRASGSASPSRA
jgi:serine/threonine-protein kinase RsbT